MTDDYISCTSSYILNLQSVLYAANRLRDSLDSGDEKLEFAVTQLEFAAKQQENSGENYRTFMFAQMETTAEEDKSRLERITEDTLATIQADMQIANILIASGQIINEINDSKKVDSWNLDTALQQLGNTAYTIERSLNIPLNSRAIPGRFGFSGGFVGVTVTKSANLSLAVDAFRSASDKTLSSLTSEAQSSMVTVIKGILHIDSTKVFDIISNFDCQIKELPRVGRLLRIGTKMLEGALNALISLLGSNNLSKIKNKITNIIDEAVKGKYAAQLLDQILGIDKAKECIKNKIVSDNLNKDALDNACQELFQLDSKFKDSMGMIRIIISTLELASILLTCLFGTNGVIFIACAYATIIGGIILIGRDYTDFGDILNRVRGVGMITKSL